MIKQGRATAPDGRQYPGGWVWRTVGEAQHFIAANGLSATHAVYGVLADWEVDTEPDGVGDRLIRDAEVVRLS